MVPAIRVSVLLCALFSWSASAAQDSLLFRVGYADFLEDGEEATDGRSSPFTVELLAGVKGAVSDPADTSAVAKIAWNEESLILRIDVYDDHLVVKKADDQLWAGDSVELFLSPKLGGGSYYQLVLAVEADGTLRSKLYDFRSTPAPALTHVSSGERTKEGYRIITRLPWSNLGIHPAAGTEAGMQLFVNDADPDQETFQMQWYPHAVSHSSDRMHRIRLETTTADKHLAGCSVQTGYDYHRLDVLMRRREPYREFDVVDGSGRKLAVGCFQPLGSGLQKAAVLLPAECLQEMTEIVLVSEGDLIGKAVIGAKAVMDGELLKSLQNITLVPKQPWGYLFEAGGRPEAVWSSPEAMRIAAGSDEARVRWFDASLNEVTSFERPGRYLAYVEAKLRDGRMVRRSATFYAIGAGSHPWRGDTRLVLYNRTRPWWHPWRGQPHAKPDYIPGLGVEPTVWQRHQPLLSAWAGKSLMDFFECNPYGAVVMSFLSEEDRYAHWPVNARTPEIANADLYLALKCKLLGVEVKADRLKPPQTVSAADAAQTLRAGSAAQAGFTEDAPARIRDVCRRWAAESGEPFAVLIARDGVVFFHEAFGRDLYGHEVTTETPMFMASITKCMSGLMLGQFIDQGLIDLDDPVGRFLREFPVEGEKAITFRHCFTHTTGLSGHYEFGGMHNPFLENAIALGLPHLPVGKLHEYNGMGYDLAGKAMERVAGKAAFRIMHEHLFEPLGMTRTVIDDMATCSTSTPMDVARLGQLILNGGAYGPRRFFSPETLQKLLPCELNTYFPAINKNWGVGMTWMLTDNPEADRTGRRYLLSDRVVGHGAASSAVFRVDLENRLIVVQTRNQAGPHYDSYLREFLQTIDQTMKRRHGSED